MWAELDRDRWSWADRARSTLRRELAGFLGADEVSGFAHVMLVGDTQAGKTTLLLHLLGVTDSEAQRDAHEVLRGGRSAGTSATAAPIRYGWSAEPDRWLLVSGAARTRESLDDAAMKERMTGYRSDDGEALRWRLGDPPLEIGLPERLATAEPRRDLRILDLPGVYAHGEEEKQLARELISAVTPGMSLIVFVEPAPQLVDALKDEAIRTDPHLSGWAKPGAGRRFRFVATQAFSTMPAWLAGHMAELEWEPHTVADLLRRHLAGQALDVARTHADPEHLAAIMFPVDLGKSRDEVDASPAAAANRLLLAELNASLIDTAGQDGLYLAEPALAEHAVAVARRNAAERAGNLAALKARTGALERELRELRERRGVLLQEAESAQREFEALQSAIRALSTSSLAAKRVPKPVMEGPAVRETQPADHRTLGEAAARLWKDWRQKPEAGRGAFPVSPPASLASEIVAEYDRRTECCRKCTHRIFMQVLASREIPEYCYGRMTATYEAMQLWLVKRLVTHAEPTLSAARDRLVEARRRADLAERHVENHQARVRESRARLRAATRKALRDEAFEQANVRRAQTVLSAHSDANRAYVGELSRRAETADPQERGFLAIAALRAVFDLNRMYSRR